MNIYLACDIDKVLLPAAVGVKGGADKILDQNNWTGGHSCILTKIGCAQ